MNLSEKEVIECLEVKNAIPLFRVKYLHFDPKEYRRPPYYGTWRKKSKFVTARRPFGRDTVSYGISLKKIDLSGQIFFFLSLKSRKYLIMMLTLTKNGKTKLKVKVLANQMEMMISLKMKKKKTMASLYHMVIYQMMKLMKKIELYE